MSRSSITAAATRTWHGDVALLTPRRRYGHEYLDDPAVGAGVAARSMGDVARSNALFGGAHAVLAELEDLLRSSTTAGRSFSLLDVGTGLGDIPARVRA